MRAILTSTMYFFRIDGIKFTNLETATEAYLAVEL